MNELIRFLCRDLRETKHRLDVTSGEVKKKDGQLKEMQFRVEHGEGCKWNLIDWFRKWLKFSSPTVLERPSSQMSYLDHFLKESAGGGSSSSNATHTPLAVVSANQEAFVAQSNPLVHSNTRRQTQHHKDRHSRTTTLFLQVLHQTISCRTSKHKAFHQFLNSIHLKISYKWLHSRNKLQLMQTLKTIQ